MRRQEVLQFHPVEINPQHGRNPRQRAVERHHHAVADHVDHRRSTCLDLAIGLDQRKPVALPQRLAIDPQTLGCAAAEHVAAQPVTPHQSRRGIAHRCEPLQPQLQAQRKLFGAGVFLLVARQQQRGLEVSQPGRHHQIVRRQFQPQRFGLFDIGQVLVDQLEDRDAAQIDLLAPGQVKQQVERPFPAVQLKVKRLVARRGSRHALPVVLGQGNRQTVDRLVHALALPASSNANRASRLATNSA